MAWPNHEAVETFMRITGASESLALRKLEEYRGNLNAAVNSHFSEGYSFNQYVAPTFPEQNYTNANGGSQGGQFGLLPLLNAARSFRPSNLLDPNYRRRLFDQMRGYPSVGSPSFSSHLQPGSVGPIPSGFNSFPAQPSHQAWRGTFEDENHTSSSSNQKTENDTEDEMLRVAIEASKQDSDLELLQRQLQREEDDLAHAVSLSLGIAEQEKAVRELTLENKDEASSIERGEPSNSGPKECRGSTSTHHRHEQDASYPNEDTGRNLAAQKTPFPPEPEINNKDSVTLLLRMPDGCRHERRFLNSDKLQLLFNFIDDKLAMKPHTYKVTRPYPRRAFGVEDGSMMLRDLGLTGKQEALFVEII